MINPDVVVSALVGAVVVMTTWAIGERAVKWARARLHRPNEVARLEAQIANLVDELREGRKYSGAQADVHNKLDYIARVLADMLADLRALRSDGAQHRADFGGGTDPGRLR